MTQASAKTKLGHCLFYQPKLNQGETMLKKLLATVVAVTAFATLKADNMLENPTFKGIDKALPPPWSLTSPDAKFKLEENGITLYTDDGKHSTLTYHLTNIVKEGIPYVFSCNYKAAKDTTTQAYVEAVTFDGKNRRWHAPTAGILNAGTNWQKRKFIFVRPPQTTSIYLAVRSIDGTPFTFNELTVRPAKIREQLGGYWTLEDLETPPDDKSIIIAGGQAAYLTNLKVEPGKNYLLSYKAKGLTPTGTDNPFHEITTKTMPAVTGGATFNDVPNKMQPKFLKLRIPESFQGDKLTVIFETKSKGKVLYYDFEYKEYIPDPMDNWKVFFNEPFYRDIIFNSNDTGRIAGEIVATAPAASARVRLEGVGTAYPMLENGKGKFFIPAKNLKPGKYQMDCRLFDAQGNELKRFAKTIRKAKPGKYETIAQPNGYFTINGKPFFPITQWDMKFGGIEEALYAKARFGVNSTFMHLKQDEESNLERLDRLHKYGIKAIIVSGCASSTAPATLKAFENATKKRITPKIIEHPATLGYFLIDEPLWGGKPHAPIAASNEIMKDIDPYHPTWVNAAPRNEVEDLIPYAEACDIYGCDIYPVPYPNNHSGIDDKGLTSVGKYCLRMDETVFGRKPIWMALQGFAWKGLKPTPVEEHIYPTLVEQRFMAYDAMLNKCTGYGLWGTHYAKSLQFHNVMYNVTTEMAKLSTVFVKGKQLDDVKTDNKNVRVAQFLFGSKRYYFVLNLTEQEQTVNFTLESLDQQLYILPETTQFIKPVNEKVSLKLTPFQVVVAGTHKLPKPICKITKPNKKFGNEADIIKKLLDEQAMKTSNLKPYTGNAKWIWARETVDVAAGIALVAKTFQVDDPQQGAMLKLAVDDYSTIYVNGKQLTEKTLGWSLLVNFDLKPYLVKGTNVILIKAEDGGSLPCGVLGELYVAGKLVTQTDSSWLAAPSTTKEPIPGMDAIKTFKPAYVIAPFGEGAWGTNVSENK